MALDGNRGIHHHWQALRRLYFGVILFRTDPGKVAERKDSVLKSYALGFALRKKNEGLGVVKFDVKEGLLGHRRGQARESMSALRDKSTRWNSCEVRYIRSPVFDNSLHQSAMQLTGIWSAAAEFEPQRKEQCIRTQGVVHPTGCSTPFQALASTPYRFGETRAESVIRPRARV